MDILFMDCESTGLEPGITSVIEIGAVFYQDGKKHSEFKGSCGPALDAEINIGALSVNRVKATELMDLGSPPALANAFVDFILQLPTKYRRSLILAGHNVMFDITHIDSFLKTNRIVDFTEFTSYRSIDTAAIGQFLIDAGVINSAKANLGVLAKVLEIGYDANQHHTALYDAELSAKLYFKMIDIVKKHTGVQHTRASWA